MVLQLHTALSVHIHSFPWGWPVRMPTLIPLLNTLVWKIPFQTACTWYLHRIFLGIKSPFFWNFSFNEFRNTRKSVSDDIRSYMWRKHIVQGGYFSPKSNFTLWYRQNGQFYKHSSPNCNFDYRIWSISANPGTVLFGCSCLVLEVLAATSTTQT